MIRKYKNQFLWLVGVRGNFRTIVCVGTRLLTVIKEPYFAYHSFFLSGLFSLPSLFLGVLWCGIRKKEIEV